MVVSHLLGIAFLNPEQILVLDAADDGESSRWILVTLRRKEQDNQIMPFGPSQEPAWKGFSSPAASTGPTNL